MDRPSNAAKSGAHWDLFCRVIDNHGDVGVCWRLASDLAERGEQVRLWIDDASALAWMAPQGAGNVEVRPWAAIDAEAMPGKVALEAFGCDLPDRFVARMGAADRPPVWINLEYLSAEDYVERSHLLRSPPPAGRPGAGLRKWFFYPGFTPGTGGLIRERDLSTRQQAFDAEAWLASVGAARAGPERVVSLFCYEQPALSEWLDRLAAAQPTVLLATAGHAARQAAAVLGPGLRRGALRVVALPALTQPDYDHLLWASDLNVVRGEDSFVRAQWAARPFVWHIYPQADDAHRVKLEEFLRRFEIGLDPHAAEATNRFWLAFNDNRPEAAAVEWPPFRARVPELLEHGRRWADRLRRHRDLTTGLVEFCDARL
jgi:uncharacterized repeat protein (TIGR03837 family)